MKNDIARMNLPYLYDACVGMHITKKKQIDKGTAGTQNLVDKFGYDTKQALHSLRILDFLRQFAETEFTDFKKAIWYNDDDFNKQYLFNLKNGKLSKEEYCEMSDLTLGIVEEHYKEIYKSQKPDTHTNDTLIDLVKEIVKLQIN